jgi:hypothetical protein
MTASSSTGLGNFLTHPVVNAWVNDYALDHIDGYHLAGIHIFHTPDGSEMLIGHAASDASRFDRAVNVEDKNAPRCYV